MRIKNKYKLLLLTLMAPFGLYAQYLVNNGAYITVPVGTELVISGNLVNLNTGGQDIIANGGAIRLTGNLSNEGTFNGSGTTHFDGTLAQEIGGAGATTFGTLVIDNLAGVSLEQNVTLNTALTFTRGVIDLNTNSLTLGSAASIGGTPGTANHIDASTGSLRKDYSGTGSFAFPVGDGAVYSPITLNFTSGTFNTGYATVGLTAAKHPSNASATHFINRYWTVSSSGISDFSCNVSAQYDDTDISGVETNLHGRKWSSGEWTGLGAVNAGSNLITGTVTGFSDFSAGEEVAFPVEWLSFDAKQQGDLVHLEWATASELNSDYFAVERSADQRTWTRLAQVSAAGYSSSVQAYQYEDKQPLGGKTYYRLRQVDLGGTFDFSNVVEISLHTSAVSVYPNPVKDVLTISFDTQHVIQATLIDMQGRMVMQSPLQSGNDKLTVRNLPAGIYLLRLSDGLGWIQEMQVVKE